MRTLNREQLGLRKFWKEYSSATQAGEPVHIITHRDDVSELQPDLKLLLKKAINEQGKGAVMGLTGAEITLLLEVLQWIAIVITIGTVIYLASKKYKFKVKRDKDGSIVIEGEPM